MSKLNQNVSKISKDYSPLLIVVPLSRNEAWGKIDASTLLVGDLSYDGEQPRNLKTPFLQPTCGGTEGNLNKCKQYGFSIGLPQSCYEGTKRLYISVLRMKVPKIKPPNYYYFVNESTMSFADAKRVCGEFADRDPCLQDAEKTKYKV